MMLVVRTILYHFHKSIYIIIGLKKPTATIHEYHMYCNTFNNI